MITEVGTILTEQKHQNHCESNWRFPRNRISKKFKELLVRAYRKRLRYVARWVGIESTCVHSKTQKQCVFSTKRVEWLPRKEDRRRDPGHREPSRTFALRFCCDSKKADSDPFYPFNGRLTFLTRRSNKILGETRGSPQEQNQYHTKILRDVFCKYSAKEFCRLLLEWWRKHPYI